MGELKHRITVRLTDAHATHLQQLAHASGLTRNEVMRRVLANTKIPSARTRQEVQDILRIQREQNRLGGLLKKALTERARNASSAAPSWKWNEMGPSSARHRSPRSFAMIITPKQPRNDKTRSRLSRLVPYMLRGEGGERCTWYMAGNLPGLDRRDDAEFAVNVMELLQEGNQRAKANKTYHVVISFHPRDRHLEPAELEEVVRRTVEAAGLGGYQYIAVRHSEQEHEHVHVAVNRMIHPETLQNPSSVQGHPCLPSACDHPRARARPTPSRPR